MIRNLGAIRLAFLALFAVLTAASWAYTYFVVEPRKRCEASGRWWSNEDRLCATPVSVSAFTGRPTPVEIEAAKAARLP